MYIEIIYQIKFVRRENVNTHVFLWV